MLIADIARVCHDVNAAFCEAMGDFTQKPWSSAPDWQRHSAISGVVAHLENPRLTPAGSHEAWLAHKRETGWRYGPVKSEERKEHPCFVPYDQLPVAQKAKDYIFRAIVHSLAHELKEPTP